jgi:hypothetical protein
MDARPGELQLRIISGGVAGCVYELLPKLLSSCDDDKLSMIGTRLMSLIGQHWRVPLSGSALWVLYKHTKFGEHQVEKLMHSIMTEDETEMRAAICAHDPGLRENMF